MVMYKIPRMEMPSYDLSPISYFQRALYSRFQSISLSPILNRASNESSSTPKDHKNTLIRSTFFHALGKVIKE